MSKKKRIRVIREWLYDFGYFPEVTEMSAMGAPEPRLTRDGDRFALVVLPINETWDEWDGTFRGESSYSALFVKGYDHISEYVSDRPEQTRWVLDF